MRSSLREEHDVQEVPTITELRNVYPTLYSNAIASLLGVAGRLQEQGGLRLGGSSALDSQFIHEHLSKSLRSIRYELKCKGNLTEEPAAVAPAAGDVRPIVPTPPSQVRTCAALPFPSPFSSPVGCYYSTANPKRYDVLSDQGDHRRRRSLAQRQHITPTLLRSGTASGASLQQGTTSPSLLDVHLILTALCSCSS